MIDQRLEEFLTGDSPEARKWRKKRPEERERLDLEQRENYASTYGVRFEDVPNWRQRIAETKKLGDGGYPKIVQWGPGESEGDDK